jgi:signal transduction histidine kinase
VAGIQHPEFTVDTGLFRQLGELLVGRDSTALVELIKNAYDADATSVLLRGDHLDDPQQAVLTVADNGIGMTDSQFRGGFLRLAARGKTEGERRSPIYQRRFTGEKGVGRLAAHKLAAVLDVTTVAAVDAAGLPLATQLRIINSRLDAADMLNALLTAERTLTMSQLDWDLIESVDTLSDVHDGLTLVAGGAGISSPTGTTLSLSRLRHKWTSSDLRDLVRQLNNFEPPRSLTQPLPSSVLPQELLFQQPIVRDASRQDPGLSLDFAGDFSDPEEFWGNVLRTAEWVLEIRAERGRDIIYALSPTKVGERSNRFGRSLTATKPHPAPERGPFFDARILLRSGHVPTTEASWTQLNSGIRVYLEGFRVLPYGEPRNDWLSLDFDYTKRTGRFEIDPLLGSPSDDFSSLRRLAARDVSLRLLPNRAFFGAVFLTEMEAGGLRTLVNREGFVPDEDYERLVEMVSVGLRLTHRARALASYNLKTYEEALEQARKAAVTSDDDGAGDEDETETGYDGDSSGTSDDGEHTPEADEADEADGADSYGHEWTVLGTDGASQGSAARLQDAIATLWTTLGLERDRPPFGDRSGTAAKVSAAELYQVIQAVDEAAQLLTEDASLLRVLASVGSQLASFTHELSQLVPTAVLAEESLSPIPGTRWPAEATHARRTVTDLRRALERQASYLVDIATTEGRRRRSRQPVRERVDAAFLAFQGTAAARRITLINDVPENLRTPPLFRAELQAVVSNLLSNAIKAAGSDGRVQITGAALLNGIRLLIQNSGVAVRPEEAENWFRPYASTTTDVDLVLGQGMGLGLPITRDLIAEYGGSVRFVRPADSFATAIEVLIPE